MSNARSLNRHAAMMNRMAQVMRVDLTAEMAQGRMSGEDWKDALVRCTGCTQPKACTLWLSEHDPEYKPSVAAPPPYCENRLMIKQLRAEVAAERALKIGS
ncbi:DUF6455 family protein [Thioclava sp.]|uniref:DUF6455 family protein n=1 Tax=Thioclava sp. TaxID=1933450 RepID=UPI003AA9B162